MKSYISEKYESCRKGLTLISAAVIPNKYGSWRKGLTLIEAAMVLALSAVVIAGVMVYFSSASQKASTQQLVQLVEGASGNIASIYAGNPRGITTAATSTELLSMGIIPQSYVTNTGGTRTATGPFGGVISAGVVQANGTAPTYTWLNITQIPTVACVAILSVNYGAGYQAVSVNVATKGTLPAASATSSEGAWLKAAGASGPAISAADRAAACSGVASNTLTFYFGA